MRIGLCCIPVNKGINFIEAWATKYSDLYEIVHSSFDLVSFICVCMTGIQKRVKLYHGFIGLCSTSNLLLTFI